MCPLLGGEKLSSSFALFSASSFALFSILALITSFSLFFASSWAKSERKGEGEESRWSLILFSSRNGFLCFFQITHRLLFAFFVCMFSKLPLSRLVLWLLPPWLLLPQQVVPQLLELLLTLWRS